MSEMLERVARAIEGALPSQMKHIGPLLARAAMGAMREPTTQMRSAACAAAWYRNDQWTAMVDSAMKDTP